LEEEVEEEVAVGVPVEVEEVLELESFLLLEEHLILLLLVQEEQQDLDPVRHRPQELEEHHHLVLPHQ
jgi:hypothetical protein